MSVYVKANSFIDEFTDAGFLQKRMPQTIEGFECAQQWREIAAAHAKPSNHGNILGGSHDMKHIASIPGDVGHALLGLDPEFFTNKARFHAWLAKHPEYKSY